MTEQIFLEVIVLNKIFGYARVSTKEQKLDRQISALKDFVSEDNIFSEKISGVSLDRPAYQKLRMILRQGDILVIKELDRLSRKKDDIVSELRYFKDKGIKVVILNIPTTKIFLKEDSEENIDWVMDMVNEILIQVFSSLAEQERKQMKQRQREGIEKAQENGVQFGRPKKVNLENKDDVAIIRKAIKKEITVVEASKLLGITRPYFYQVKKRYINRIERKKDT